MSKARHLWTCPLTAEDRDIRYRMPIEAIVAYEADTRCSGRMIAWVEMSDLDLDLRRRILARSGTGEWEDEQ